MVKPPGIVFLVTLVMLVVSACGGEPPRRGPPSIQNMGAIAELHRRRARKHGWPDLSGREFALRLFAGSPCDARNPEFQDLFWPDGVAPASVDRSRYARITAESLGHGEFSDLTAAAGRRNTDARYRLKEPNPDPPEPVLGWIVGQFAIIGFSNGATRWLDREALGLAESDPLVFGDDAKSPILRALSDE